jgi:hypothetical protein
VIALKAASPHPGRITVLWKLGHWYSKVEAVHIASPNILMFQLVTEGDQFFGMGGNIPLSDTMVVDDLCTAWAKCPTNCKPLLLGDLYVDFRAP